MADLVYTLVIRDDGTAVVKRVTAAVKGVGQAGEEAGTRMQTGGRRAKEELSQLDRTLQRLQRTAMAFLGMWILTRAIRIPREVISSAFEFNTQIETARLGIASILMAQGEFTNSVGYSVQGYEKLIAAQHMSGKLVQQLQLDNLRTIATFDQLVKAFQQTLAPGLAKGFNVEMVREFTVAMVQAAGALGLNLDMLAEETRSLLRGTISPRQTLIATALGITNEDIRRFQGNAGALFDYIMGRLKAFSIAGVESQKTWLGVTSNLKDAIKIVLGAGFEDLFVFAKREAQALMDVMIKFNVETGKAEINPELIRSLRQISYLIQMLYGTFKNIATIIDGLRKPVDLLIEALRTVDILAKARPLFPKTPEKKEEEKTRVLGIPLFTEPKWFGKYRGKGIIESMTMALKDFNEYLSGDKAKAALASFDESLRAHGGAYENYVVRARELTSDEYEYLSKVASEIGYVNDKLKERIIEDAKIKGINVDLESLSGKQLQAAIKTVEEYNKLKESGEETLEAFTKLLNVRLRIAQIEEIEAPLKIAQQMVQATDRYGQQKKIIADMNKLGQEKLQLTGQLTPELKKQMNLQTAFSIAEVDRIKQLTQLERQRDIAGLQQTYAQITGDIEGQVKTMRDLANVEVQGLMIQIARTQDLSKQKDLWEKIRAINILSEKEQEQFRVTTITQREDIVARTRSQYAEMTGDIKVQDETSQILLENEIRRLKVSGELSEDQKRVKEYYLRQIEAGQAITRNLEKQREILNYQRELSVLQGDYTKGKNLEIALLENEKKRLIENNKNNWEAVIAINDYYNTLIAIAEAQRDLDFSKLVNLGAQREMATLNQQLADSYQNLLPNAIGTAADSFGNFFDQLGSGTVNAKDALENLVTSASNGFRRMIIDIGMMIVKMETLKALGYGGMNVFGWGGIAQMFGKGGAIQGQPIPITNFQEGGMLKTTRPTLFATSERGGTEYIIPEDKMGKSSGKPIFLTIVNVVDQRQLDMYMASSRGQNAIVNSVGSQIGVIKRILRS